MPCAFALTQACQAGVATVAIGDSWPDLGFLTSLLPGVPRPRSYGDALASSIVLFRFIQRAGVEIHKRIHEGPKRGTCEFTPARYERVPAVEPSHPEEWDAAAAFDAWAAAYTIGFWTIHSPSVADRARERMRSSGSSLRLADLARDVGCSVATLQRHFHNETGEAAGHHAIRLRVLRAFDLLRTTLGQRQAVRPATGSHQAAPTELARVRQGLGPGGCTLLESRTPRQPNL
jgi:AraC-like DNA-binding protein